ncbi:unnamed protein product [Lupinus luteus]|uniref:C2 domain-containing protein n=1 Tax=Lupinus luteus TaxID=3873 RepID=A0AAV1X7I0_LUPLU
MAIGYMEVLLVKAKGLHESDIFSRMDPYVLVQYKGQESKSSTPRGAGSDPVWNERIVFKVEYPDSGGKFKLCLKIMDKDVFSADDFVGQAVIYVKDLLAEGAEKGSAQLHPRKYSVVRENQIYCGEVEVGVTFTLKEEEHCDNDIGGWKESHHYLHHQTQ